MTIHFPEFEHFPYYYSGWAVEISPYTHIFYFLHNKHIDRPADQPTTPTYPELNEMRTAVDGGVQDEMGTRHTSGASGKPSEISRVYRFVKLLLLVLPACSTGHCPCRSAILYHTTTPVGALKDGDMENGLNFLFRSTHTAQPPPASPTASFLQSTSSHPRTHTRRIRIM